MDNLMQYVKYVPLVAGVVVGYLTYRQKKTLTWAIGGLIVGYIGAGWLMGQLSLGGYRGGLHLVRIPVLYQVLRMVGDLFYAVANMFA